MNILGIYICFFLEGGGFISPPGHCTYLQQANTEESVAHTAALHQGALTSQLSLLILLIR